MKKFEQERKDDLHLKQYAANIVAYYAQENPHFPSSPSGIETASIKESIQVLSTYAGRISRREGIQDLVRLSESVGAYHCANWLAFRALEGVVASRIDEGAIFANTYSQIHKIHQQELEKKDMSPFGFYMDLVVMYHVIGKPLDIFKKHNFYEIIWPIHTHHHLEAYHEVQEQIRIVAGADCNVSRADNLVHLAQRLQEKDTISSTTALLWLESSLGARAIQNRSVEAVHRRERSAVEVQATKEALERIRDLTLKRAA